MAQAEAYQRWAKSFLTEVAPGEKDIVKITGHWDDKEYETACEEYRAFGGGMETLSPLDVIRVVPSPLSSVW